eukprot:9186635-Pyramimonas_sp.AAC.1
MFVRVQSVTVAYARRAQWDMIRLLDIGVAWISPLRQVPPLLLSYRDQHIVVGDQMCGYSVKVI